VTNLYHFTEDLLNAFVALHLLQRAEPCGGWEAAELAIADEPPAVAGPFLAAWAALFPGAPVRFLARVRAARNPKP